MIAMLFSALICSVLSRFCAGDGSESFKTVVGVIPSRGAEKLGR